MKLKSIMNYHTLPGTGYHIEMSLVISSALLFVTHGNVTYTIDGQTIILQPGDIIFMPVNTLRSVHSSKESAFYRYTLIFDEKSDESALSILNEHKKQIFNTIRFDYIKQRLSLAHEVWIDKSPYYEMISHGIVAEIIGILQRELISKAHGSVKLNLVVQIQHYMRDHYRENVRVADIAQQVDRTPNYLSTIFKEVTGKSPKEYLNHLRIGVATDLLRGTQMTIGQISDYLGFCDQAYFNYIYKKVTGEPPSSLLKKSRKNHS